MPSNLGLVQATTSWTVTSSLFRSRTHEEGYAFEDWTVDETPLRNLLDSGTLGGLKQETTYLTEHFDREAVAQINRLPGHSPPDFEDGRVALLICPIDWDLDCGAITAAIVIGQATVEWRDLGWQTTNEPEVELAEPPVTLVFERPDYEQVLLDAQAHYTTPPGARAKRHGGAKSG